MEDILLLVAYGSLRKAREDIAGSPVTQESAELSKRVNDALDFHKLIGDLTADLVKALGESRETLDRLTADADYIPVSARSYRVYVEMAEAGCTPLEIYNAAITDGIGTICAIAALRSAFNMPIRDALQIKELAEQ